MLDALEADLESMLAAPGVVANPIDFVVMTFKDVRMNSREIMTLSFHWMPWTLKSCFREGPY